MHIRQFPRPHVACRRGPLQTHVRGLEPQGRRIAVAERPRVARGARRRQTDRVHLGRPRAHPPQAAPTPFCSTHAQFSGLQSEDDVYPADHRPVGFLLDRSVPQGPTITAADAHHIKSPVVVQSNHPAGKWGCRPKKKK
ncbi:MAG: hypothetical protein BJ554DRAFT_4704 [Olpidium bornovanus]|uniref:Uncharacterized protein n=1 Tax=Olpidium bornovanus TaxID=278681 RepID=A0A8H8DEX3_9FUNG|nr:MAG: hypothetical protein BJ554DRAFT_4704 [Olpidium bornovanus]